MTLLQVRDANSTFSWFVVGQIFASVALKQLAAVDPYDFRVPIYTQVCRVPPSIFSIRCVTEGHYHYLRLVGDDWCYRHYFCAPPRVPMVAREQRQARQGSQGAHFLQRQGRRI